MSVNPPSMSRGVNPADGAEEGRSGGQIGSSRCPEITLPSGAWQRDPHT